MSKDLAYKITDQLTAYIDACWATDRAPTRKALADQVEQTLLPNPQPTKPARAAKAPPDSRLEAFCDWLLDDVQLDVWGIALHAEEDLNPQGQADCHAGLRDALELYLEKYRAKFE